MEFLVADVVMLEMRWSSPRADLASASSPLARGFTSGEKGTYTMDVSVGGVEVLGVDSGDEPGFIGRA